MIVQKRYISTMRGETLNERKFYWFQIYENLLLGTISKIDLKI